MRGLKRKPKLADPRIFLILALLGLLTGRSAAPVTATPPAPNLVSPSHGAITSAENYPPTGTPTFVWEPVEGATLYHIDISANIAFTAIVDQTNTPHTTYTPIRTLADGTYYWRVRALDASGWGEYSQIWEFTKSWSNNGVIKPVLLNPTDGAELNFLEYPTFSWLPIPGAAKYKVEIARDPSFSTLVTPQSRETPATTYTPFQKLANGTYYWRVVPIDSRNNRGTPSDYRSFTMKWDLYPTLLYPPDDPTFSHPLDFTPTFSWTAVKGAHKYKLEVSTAEDFSSFVPGFPVNTPNTSYTPPKAFENDKNYFWRVKAIDKQGNEGPYSEVRCFLLRWSYHDQRPIPLTPPNLSIGVNMPFFSWTPVRGAAKYELEVNKDSGFHPSQRLFLAQTPHTSYVFNLDAKWDYRPYTTYFWRVRAVDRDGHYGQWSNEPPSIAPSFISGSGNPVAPDLLYPSYFYTPTMQNASFNDRTIAIPTFMWNHLQGTETYTLQVAEESDPSFLNPVYTATTANLSHTPTDTNPFVDGGIYYWRVSGDGGMHWSQSWKFRIDTSRLPPGDAGPPQLLRPTYKEEPDHKVYGQEVVEYFPNLEWTPVAGAARYEVQFSLYPDFAQLAGSAQTIFTNYTPPEKYPYGTYYWRVRALDASGQPITDWSEVYHFVLSAQPCIVGYPATCQVATDPSGDVPAPYDLTEMFISMENLYWHIQVRLQEDGQPVRLGFYLDRDHADDSGATYDPLGLSISTVPVHKPEHVIYWDLNGGTVTTATLYTWVGNGWYPTSGYPLVSIGGQAIYTPTTGLVHLSIPKTAIATPHSLSVIAFTMEPSGDSIKDTVPSDLKATSIQRILTVFASESAAPSPVLPPNNPAQQSQVITHTVTPPLMWHSIDHAVTYYLEVARDYGFSNIYQNQRGEVPKAMLYSPSNPYFVPHIAYEDNNTYYWRLAMLYVDPVTLQSYRNPGGQPFQFTKFSFVPQNLQAGPSYATPAFTWEPVEGAAAYRIEVSKDPTFSPGNIVDQAEVTLEGFVPTKAYADGTYYWRVRIRDGNNNYGQYSPVQTFAKTSPAPDGLRTVGGSIVNYNPTFQWNAVLTPTEQPVIGAPSYRLKVSTDPNFSTIYETRDTDSVTYTPCDRAYADGTYYWKVAMLDANGREGTYSKVMTVTKQYPVTALTNPPSGSELTETPTFSWEPIYGASAYRLEVSTDPNFAGLKLQITTNNTTYTPTQAWTPGTYYWRVAMVDINNNLGPYNIGSFILQAKTPIAYLPLVMK